MSTTMYRCTNCSWEQDDAREAMWHAADNGHVVDPAPRGARLPALPALEFTGDHAEPEAAPEVVAEVHRQHRRYAISQIKAKRDTMARELARDSASGRLTGLARVRAAARLASYNDLINCLTTLKGLS